MMFKFISNLFSKSIKQNSLPSLSLEDQYLAKNYNPLPITLTKGLGTKLWDDRGKEYLDCLSAYSAVSAGHSHPRIIEAMNLQLQRLDVPSRAFKTDQLGLFAQKLCDFTGMDQMLPMNTGAEAVETAIKAARRWGYQVKKIPSGKAKILVSAGNFHGRTTTIVGFSSEEAYKEDFGPFDGGFEIIPFGDSKALEQAIDENVCAFLTEPMQGEAGINVPPKGWLKRVQKICKKRNVLLILDEIQTGLGRTGKNFAFQHEIDEPDCLILGKALGGGVYPVSAFLARKDVMDVFDPGSHGSTFGGNPIACAIGIEALNILIDEDLTRKSADLGAYLMKQLQKIDSDLITDIRGSGLWVGVDIDPDKASARSICEALMVRGVLCKETHETVIRFAPPLVISKEEIDYAVGQFKVVLSSFSSN